MKKIITFTVIVLLLSTHIVVAQCSRTGNFMPTDVNTTGSVTLLFNSDGTKKIQLGSDFSTSAGPDIHVVLCKTAFYNRNTDVVISGDLTQTSGAQSFTVTSAKVKNLNDYQYILIHCIQYNHRFGFAALGNSTGSGCATLATNSFNEDKENFEIFPNPSTDFIRFSIDQPATVSIYNGSGEKVLSDYKIDDKNTSISLESYSNGLYIVQLDLNGNNYFKKIIKN